MANCPNCGAPVADNAQGCNACGHRFAPAPKSAPVKAPVNALVCDKIDIEHNRGYAFISYFGILFLVPLFFAKHSKFARYHCNQGILITLLGVALSIVTAIVSAICGALGGLLGGLLGDAVNYTLGTVITAIFGLFSGFVGFLASAAVIVLIVFGLINVFKGRCKPVPVIGKIVIFKY